MNRRVGRFLNRTRHSPWFLLVAAVALATPLKAQQAQAGEPPIADLSRSVVTITVATPGGSSLGSGVIVDSSGIIVTAAHVIAGGTSAQVRLASGDILPVEGVLDVDVEHDVALLRIAGYGLPAAHLGNSDSLTLGQRLIAIGSPLGLEATVSDGLLSGNRLTNGIRLLQVSVPISPGSSGGPLFDSQGAVVGIAVSTIVGDHAQNLNFAVPINYVRGRLSLARSKPLTAFAVAAAGSRESASTSTNSAFSSPEPATRVNSDLRADISVLDGTEWRAEQTDEQGGQHHLFVSYHASHTPQGDLEIERVSEDRVQIKRGLRHFDAYTDRVRSVYDQGAAPQITEEGDRTVFLTGMLPSTYNLTIAGGSFSMVYRGVSSSGPAPIGSVTPLFIGALLAASPDSLPPEQFIWAFDLTAGKVIPAHLAFGPRDSLDVPLAVTPGGCADGADTKRVQFAVVWVRLSVGSREDRYPVLADRPHLNVNPRSVKCIKLPDGPTRSR